MGRVTDRRHPTVICQKLIHVLFDIIRVRTYTHIYVYQIFKVFYGIPTCTVLYRKIVVHNTTVSDHQ